MLLADVNEFHPLVNGHAYAAGRASDGSPYSVVILRATYSTTHVDNAYASSLAQARTAGLLVGHYGYMTQSADAAAQGAFFGRTVKAHGGVNAGDTIWCDCEEGSGDQSSRVAAFLAGAHAVLKDDLMDEGVYSGASFWGAHLGTLSKGVHRWIAAYGAARPALGEDLFQFTDAQNMPGVSGPCDCSIFTGTLDQFKATFCTKPAPTPPHIEKDEDMPLIITYPGPKATEAYLIKDGKVAQLMSTAAITAFTEAGVPRADIDAASAQSIIKAFAS